MNLHAQSPIRSLVVTLALAGSLASPAVAQGPLGTLRGGVLCDTNPLPGVSVTARDLFGPGVPVSGITDSNGFYSLSVGTGFYEVSLSGLPEGLSYVSPPDGTNRFPVAPGGISTANFRLTGCTTPALSTLGGSVWLDLDCDGIRQPEESGVAGVPVSLLDCQAQLLGETVTDEQGAYEFEELPAGSYRIHFLAPNCRVFTQYRQGDDPDRDSDADPALGVTDCIPLPAGVTNLAWSAGLCVVEGSGTRSQGYWKTHPQDWPMEEIEIGGVSYDKHTAIAIMRQPTRGNKRLNLFEQLVAAKLNRALCNEAPDIDELILCADLWMERNPGVVRASSVAWKRLGSSLHDRLEAYNEGRTSCRWRDGLTR